MRFAEWMTAEGLTDADVAAKLRIKGFTCDRTTVSRWRRHVRRPEWDVIGALRELSGGKVTADSFEQLSGMAQ